MFRRLERVMAALLLSVLATTAYAQQALTAASVTGRVRDAARNPLSGVHVTMTSDERNQRASATTDRDGRFRFPPLAPGSYTLEADSAGLAKFRRAVTLTIAQSLDIPITLVLPTQTDSIVVSAMVPVVETTRTQVATTIAPEEVKSLPLNGRNYLDLALLAPGVSRTNTGANQRFAETSAVPGTGISVSTQRNLSNSFLIDGLSANDDAAELAGSFYSQEVIREFQVVRSAGIAEFGRASGGVINIVTQAGTNALRGDAYGFFRNQRFDGRNALSGTRLPLDQQQYGASVSGPLIRDRMFFFANFEQLRQTGGGFITISPANVVAINNRLDTTGYGGARLTAGGFDTTLGTTNFFFRGDHSLSPNAQLTARLSSYDVSSDNARTAGGLNAVSRGTSLSNHDRTLALNSLWTLSGNMFSETRAQVTRSRLSAPPNDLTGPAVNIAGIASFGTATFSPTGREIDLYEFVEDVTWQRGRHSAKAGVDLLRNRVVIDFPGALQGVYTFSTLANFLTGSYSTFQQAFGDAETRQTNDNLGVFIQDEWRPAASLTINGGLRYDLQYLPSLVHTDRNNFSPRVGLAWDFAGDGRSVIRAGAGVYYNRIPLRAIANVLQRNGVSYRIAQITQNTAGAPSFPNVYESFPTGVLTGVNTIDPDIQDSSSMQSTVQYERQLTSSMSASVGYEHLRGHDIIMSRNINAPTTTNPAVPNLGRPDPRFGNNAQYQSIGDSWYDGMTVSVVKRPSARSSVRLSYTFSKGLDTSGNFFFSSPQDNSDIAAERGRSDNDQRHRLTISGTVLTPAGTAASALQRLAGGWTFSYLFAYASPLPFNIQLPNDRNGDTNFNDRPPGVGRNSGNGFDYQSLDLRIGRSFRLGGGMEAEPMLEVFNALNRKNEQVPNNIFGSPTFGKATAVNDPRQMQLGLRLTF